MLQKNKRLSKKVKINGIIVEVVTISGLANIIGKSRNTVLRYEREDIFPEAPIRMGNYRYYPISLAQRLVDIVKKIPSYKKPEPDLICEITSVFNQETAKYAKKKG